MGFFIKYKKKNIVIMSAACIAVVLLSAFIFVSLGDHNISVAGTESTGKFIKYVEFNPSSELMNKAYKYDIQSVGQAVHINWIELLSYCAARCGGEFSSKSYKDMESLVKRLQNGENIENITADMKYFKYYKEAYTAVLSGFVGGYVEVNTDGNVNGDPVTKYGIRAFCPIAKGYGYSHSDDFGNARTFGYRRTHLGNDMFGMVGSPVIAVESGTVEALGWNMYGGWRIGIRSSDGKRYYYYAHLRKNRPYAENLKQGDSVIAGQVIGYLGMTGYSTKENVNGITQPHLHFGMELVFDESQKESYNEIWVDVYNIVNFLEKNKSAVVKNSDTKEQTATLRYMPVDK